MKDLTKITKLQHIHSKILKILAFVESERATTDSRKEELLPARRWRCPAESGAGREGWGSTKCARRRKQSTVLLSSKGSEYMST